jgi:hypothetical protein
MTIASATPARPGANAAQDVRPRKGGKGLPSTTTATSVRGMLTLMTPSSLRSGLAIPVAAATASTSSGGDILTSSGAGGAVRASLAAPCWGGGAVAGREGASSQPMRPISMVRRSADLYMGHSPGRASVTRIREHGQVTMRRPAPRHHPATGSWCRPPCHRPCRRGPPWRGPPWRGRQRGAAAPGRLEGPADAAAGWRPAGRLRRRRRSVRRQGAPRASDHGMRRGAPGASSGLATPSTPSAHHFRSPRRSAMWCRLLRAIPSERAAAAQLPPLSPTARTTIARFVSSTASRSVMPPMDTTSER